MKRSRDIGYIELHNATCDGTSFRTKQNSLTARESSCGQILSKEVGRQGTGAVIFCSHALY
jgi:hypothetical protein